MNNQLQQAPPPYPRHAFPDEIRLAIEEVMEKVMAPDALICMSFIGAISTACQGLIDVKLPIGMVVPTSLNLLVKAESGERKTTVDKIVGDPIYAHDEENNRHIKSDESDYQADLIYWKTINSTIQSMLRQAIKKGECVEDLHLRLDQHIKARPTQRNRHLYIHQDATESALMQSLEGKGKSIAIYTDEGEVVLKGGLMNRVGLRNKGWDGARILKSNRITTGTIIAEQPRVTINMLVQNAVFDDYQRDRGAVNRGSGFWARFLVGEPASTQGFRFIRYVDEEWHYVLKFHSHISERLDQYDRMISAGEVERQVFEFDAEAAAEWVNAFNSMEALIQPWQYLRDIADFASKASEMIARVAALLHFFTKQEGKITVNTLQQAKAIVNWHVHEFKRLFSPQIATLNMQASIMDIERFLFLNYWKEGVSYAGKNQVLRNGPYYLRQKASLEPVIEAMVAQRKIWLCKDIASNRAMIGMTPDHFNSLRY